MLSNIKSMIKEKTEFLEAASLIYEDGSVNLDDFIVLGEEGDADMATEIDEAEDKSSEKEMDDEDEDVKDEKETGEDDKKEEPDEGNEGSEDILNADINGQEPSDEPTPVSDGPSSDDIMNADINEPAEEPLPLPGDDLPTPVGAQTGEPVNPLNDILNVEIDLGTNTVKDVLPVPPANASDSLSGDDTVQHVDSGFGGESEDISMPAEESARAFDPFKEAITIGDEPPADEGTKDDAAAEEPTDTEEPAEGEESEVTTAVRDKVSEVDTPAPGGEGSSSKEDLLKKLGNITKSLEDAKKAVMNTIQ